MTDQQASYRQILKATSIFGGVQVFNIIIAIIRSKIIAVLLGPVGMGIAGLLNSTTQMIGGITNFGLGTSAVKNVSAANAACNKTKVSTVIIVLRRLVWITGTLGTIVTLVLSPWLSKITFGNTEYTLAFVWISITLLFKQITTGQLVLLQGLRKLNYLAKANLAGTSMALLITVPIYFKWGIDGIVPAIILTAAVIMLFSWHFSRKIKIDNVNVNWKTTIHEGKDMLKMGFMLSLSGLITTGAAYILRIFISNKGGVAQVGLYNAGFAIINTYVGMVFIAMATDYYPRLSGVARSNRQARRLINQQATMAILILAPILALFLVFIKWVVILLYSAKFRDVNGMICWAALGIYFKAASWSIGIILLAKGVAKVYFWNELIANIYMLGFNIIGYQLGGLNGLGVSFLVSYVFYLIQIFTLAKIKYSFFFEKAFYQIFSIQFLLGLLCFGTVKGLNAPWSYVVGSMLILLSVVYSWKELDKSMGLRILLRNFINKRN